MKNSGVLFKNSLKICFSLSVPSTFLSSLFISFPGALNEGKLVWNTKSCPEVSAAFRASRPA